MNALKTPFLGGLRSGSLSRSATPSLPSPDPTTAHVSDPLAAALAPNAALATAAAAPGAFAPASAVTASAAANPPRGRVKTLSSLTPFKRANSPAPPQPAQQTAPQTLVQDGSYLQQLSLKLGDAVTKALALPPVPVTAVAEPVIDGKGPLPAGRGRCLGSLISSELRATEGNVNLQRAFLRLLQRVLSVLLTSLNAHMLPLLSSPAFVTPFATGPSGPFNATQAHALGLAAFAGELLESFDTLGLGTAPEASGSSSNGRSTPLNGNDGLRPVREGLESIITKVACPLLAQVRRELQPLLDALEQPPLAPSPSLKPSLTMTVKSSAPSVTIHPAVNTLVGSMPAYSRALARLVALSPIVHRALASCLIALHWRAMVALAHRPCIGLPVSTPPGGSVPLPTVSKKLFGGPTPPGTPSRFLMKLPSSRPPSPPSPPTADPLVLEAKKVYDLLAALPKPANGDALEAVDEGLEAFDALLALMRVRGDPALVPEDVPTLVALPVVLRAAGIAASVPALTQLGEGEYHVRCLSGFVRAAECGPLIARTVADVLDTGDDARAPLLEWLRRRAA